MLFLGLFKANVTSLQDPMITVSSTPSEMESLSSNSISQEIVIDIFVVFVYQLLNKLTTRLPKEQAWQVEINVMGRRLAKRASSSISLEFSHIHVFYMIF